MDINLGESNARIVDLLTFFSFIKTNFHLLTVLGFNTTTYLETLVNEGLLTKLKKVST